MSLGTFYDDLRAATRRGTSLDSRLPAWTRRAARFIERNYTFQYMKRWAQLTVNSAAAYPHIISLYGYEFKRIRSLRYLSSQSSRYVDLPQGDPQDRATRLSGLPSSFWLDGVSNLVLDAIPQENLALELHADLFTIWQTNESWDHWLLRNAEDLLTARTLMIGAKELSDAKMYEVWKNEFVDAQTTFNVAEEALQSGPIMQMWAPPYDEFDSNFDGVTNA